MLDFFRHKGLTSAIYGVIIVGMILVFVLGFNPTAGKKLGSVNEACAARVRGSCIEPKAHRAAYRLVFSRGTGQLRQQVASKIVLEGLIERELLAAEASRLGLTVSEEEVSDSIFHGFVRVSLPSDNLQLQQNLGLADGKVRVGFQDPKTKQFDMKVYERTIKMMTGRSPGEFREWQTRELLAAKMRDLVRTPVRVPEEEALDRFTTERTTATIGYAVVRRSWVEKYGMTADPKDIEAWSKDKTNLGQIKVPVRHILIDTRSAKPEEKDGIKKKAEDILARVKKGEDFAKLAKEFSADPGSKDKGGQYPGEMVEQFVEPFKKAVESVKPGELVPNLVETQFGWHIIKRDEASKDDIAKAYKQSKSLDLTKSMAQKIIEAVKGGKPGEEAVKDVMAQFAVVKVLPVKKPEATGGDAGAPKKSADGGAGDAGAASAEAGAEEKPLTFDTDPERPQWLKSSAFNRGGSPIPGVSGEATEQLLKHAFTAKNGEVAPEPIRTDDGFLVLNLIETKPATKAEFEKERDQYVGSLLAAKQNEALAFYVRRLRDASKSEIKVDEGNVFGAKSDAGAAPTEDDEP